LSVQSAILIQFDICDNATHPEQSGMRSSLPASSKRFSTDSAPRQYSWFGLKDIVGIAEGETRMKNALKGLLTSGLFASAAAFAQPATVHYVYAPVLDHEPVYVTEQVPVEREVCWQERGYREPRGNSATGTIAGAIIGGVIGNQFGGGSGRKALTAAGAALGASIGHDASRQHRRHGGRAVSYERCEIQVDYEARTYMSGYRVRYEYNGEVFETRTRSEPDDVIRLEISARPAG